LAIAVLLGASLQGQALNPELLSKPLSDSWPTYSGDYSGKRYSLLKQIDQSNIKHLTLAWSTRVTAGLPNSSGAGRGGFGGPAAAPTIIGGEGTGELNEASGRSNRIVGAVLMVDGVLYASAPDNAWAINAADGQLLWHYVWKTKGGTHTGNRGLGMWGNWLYMETPDDPMLAATTTELFQLSAEPHELVVLPNGNYAGMLDDDKRNYENRIVSFFLVNLPPGGQQ